MLRRFLNFFHCSCITKKFYPSEFGNDVDRTNAVEPAKSAFANKAQIRRAIESEGIPHTYVSSNCFAGYFLPTLAQPAATAPPRDKVVILGDGNAKGKLNQFLSFSSKLLSNNLCISQWFSMRNMTLELTPLNPSMTQEL